MDLKPALIAGFRAVYLCAVALCLAAGGLVTASLFMPDRAPQSGTFLTISLAVAGVFAIVGAVCFGIRRHVSAVAALAVPRDDAAGAALARHVVRLTVQLLLGGVLLCLILAVLTYAILARIDQGFAVFG